MSRKTKKSLADIFWNFVRENPQAAAALAFEIGIWAGEKTGGTDVLKRAIKMSPKFLNAIPQDISDMSHAALKMLSDPPPTLHSTATPSKRRRGKKLIKKAA
jgi:hypothetical protein